MIVGFKSFIDLFDVVCTLVVYITYNMGNRDLPDIYTLALRLRCIYQANLSYPCYNLYISYNMDTRALPDIYARCPRAQHQRASAYISGKARVPVL